MVLKLVKVPSNETLEICTQHTLQMGETERARDGCWWVPIFRVEQWKMLQLPQTPRKLRRRIVNILNAVMHRTLGNCFKSRNECEWCMRRTARPKIFVRKNGRGI